MIVNNFIKHLYPLLWSFSFFLMASSTFASNNIRPITDYTNAQGSTLVSLGPTTLGELFGGRAFIWGSSLDLLLRVDSAGTDLKGLLAIGGPDAGTTFNGIITEKPLSDGRAEVKVKLITHNAITFATNGSTFPTNCSNGPATFFTLCPAVFGYTIVELANGVGQPVTGDSLLELNFINTAPGAPIPDLLNLILAPAQGQTFKSLSVQAVITGPLRANFGVAEGTKGIATLDVYVDPVTDNEIVTLRALGK